MISVISYEKMECGGNLIALVAIHLLKTKQIVRNIAILLSKESGWYLKMPTYKNRKSEKWEVAFEYDDAEVQKKFELAVRKAIEDYAKEKGYKIV